MAARHAKLLALAQKNSIGMNFIRLVNSSPEGLTEDFGDCLTWSESMTR